MSGTEKNAKQTSAEAESTEPPQLSIAALARELGVERNTIYSWMQRPDHPKRRDPEAWLGYIIANNLGGQTATGAEEKKERLEITRLEKRILQQRVDREDRRVVSKQEVNELLVKLASNLRSLLLRTMESELPPLLDGMSAVQMRPILRDRADSLLDQMSELVAQSQEEK